MVGNVIEARFTQENLEQDATDHAEREKREAFHNPHFLNRNRREGLAQYQQFLDAVTDENGDPDQRNMQGKRVQRIRLDCLKPRRRLLPAWVNAHSFELFLVVERSDA